MPSYMAFCEDGPGATALRAQHLSAHLSYVEGVMEQIQVAGPLRENAEGDVGASSFIYTADSLGEAQALLEGDPYFAAGIYASVRWFHFIPAAGEWVGGKNWD